MKMIAIMWEIDFELAPRWGMLNKIYILLWEDSVIIANKILISNFKNQQNNLFRIAGIKDDINIWQ